jgi:CheY-like chemotaxis protein
MTLLGDETLTLTVEHERRFAALRHRLRAIAYRLGADCERLLDEPHVAARPAVRDALRQCLLATRRLISLTSSVATADGRAETRLNEGARELQQSILSALSGALTLVAVNLNDALVVQDIRNIRDTAKDIIASVADQDAELPSGAAAVPDAVIARVLVAEDDDALRELLERTLTSMGYEVHGARDGQAALDQALATRPDLVLTDIDMPRLDGLSLLKELKSRDETRDIPVIVVSSERDLQRVADIIASGAEEHIVKPFQPMLLRARVTASLERKRLRDAERDQRKRVFALTEAAEAVERDAYVPGSLSAVSAPGDALGRLARVFDRMVSGLKFREHRLRQRLGTLRHEVVTSAGDPTARSPSTEGPFVPGQVVGGRFEIVRLLGKGGMGLVFRARDRELDEDVAIKVIRADLIKLDPMVLERLKSEIRLARKISHPNVVRLHDLGEENGAYFVSMEFVEGITVAELLDRRGYLSVEATLAICTQLCEALAVAHAQHIVHRDITAANLLVDANGGLKVLDFGIARSLDPDGSRLTHDGLIIGTPQYMSPEQLLGRNAGVESDLYSVGVVMYECLSGRAPFSGDSPVALMTEIVDGNVPRIDSLLPDLPAGLGDLIHQQLRFDPAGRSSSAAELARRLQEIDANA